jgi:uncharacterized PurR-regulated membrane protein YhhQ (DUF165 family)
MFEKFIQYVYDAVLKSWKSSLAGAIIFLATFLVSQNKITQSEFEIVVGVLTAAGLLVAKDADQTHSDNG